MPGDQHFGSRLKPAMPKISVTENRLGNMVAPPAKANTWTLPSITANSEKMRNHRGYVFAGRLLGCTLEASARSEDDGLGEPAARRQGASKDQCPSDGEAKSRRSTYTLTDNGITQAPPGDQQEPQGGFPHAHWQEAGRFILEA